MRSINERRFYLLSFLTMIALSVPVIKSEYSSLAAKVPVSKPSKANSGSSSNSSSGLKITAPSEQQFMKNLADKVQAQLNANRPGDLKTATEAVLLIKMNKLGVVEEVKVDTSSGVPEADQAALQAVRKSAPFGRIPTKFQDGLALKYTFRFGASKAQPLSVDEKNQSDDYMKKIREKISRNWKSPEVPTKCKATIYFLIEPSGKIKTAKLKKTSGIKSVDDAALAAIIKSAPFEPLPEVWKSGYGVEYTLAAGPKSDIQHYKFNDVKLPDGDFQISRGGAKLHPLEFNHKIENQLQDKKWAAEDKLKLLQLKLESASNLQSRSEVLVEIAKINLELHQFDQAVKSLNEACEIESGIDPVSSKYSLALKELAEAQRLNNELDKACLTYQKCIELLKTQGTENGTNLKDLRETLTGYAKTLYKLNKVKEGNAVYAEIKALN